MLMLFFIIVFSVVCFFLGILYEKIATKQRNICKIEERSLLEQKRVWSAILKNQEDIQRRYKESKKD